MRNLTLTTHFCDISQSFVSATNCMKIPLYAVHDYFKHAVGQDIFLLDWRQVLSYDVSFLNIRIVVNSVINLVNKNLPRTALQICMFHFNTHYPTSTRRHGNFAKVHTLLRILLSSNSAVLINIITGVLPPHFDFVVYYVLCQC
jgi:hypothetical protein